MLSNRSWHHRRRRPPASRRSTLITYRPPPDASSRGRHSAHRPPSFGARLRHLVGDVAWTFARAMCNGLAVLVATGVVHAAAGWAAIASQVLATALLYLLNR